MTIQEIEDWFKTAPAPEMPIYLDEANKVLDYELFVNSHLEGLKFAKVEMTKAPLMARLLKMKLLIEANL